MIVGAPDDLPGAPRAPHGRRRRPRRRAARERRRRRGPGADHLHERHHRQARRARSCRGARSPPTSTASPTPGSGPARTSSPTACRCSTSTASCSGCSARCAAAASCATSAASSPPPPRPRSATARRCCSASRRCTTGSAARPRATRRSSTASSAPACSSPAPRPLPAPEFTRIEQLTGQQIVERYGLTETLMNTAVRADSQPRPGYVGVARPRRRGAARRRRRRRHRRAPTTRRSARSRCAAPTSSPATSTAPTPPTRRCATAGSSPATSPPSREDGYWRIVGRRSTDLIKTGGYKVGAGEIEVALLEHPGVLEAAVTGEEDPDLGEKIIAWVVADGERPPEKDLIDHVAGELAPHKRPREVRFLDELPRNAMGKVVKQRLNQTDPAAPVRRLPAVLLAAGLILGVVLPSPAWPAAVPARRRVRRAAGVATRRARVRARRDRRRRAPAPSPATSPTAATTRASRGRRRKGERVVFAEADSRSPAGDDAITARDIDTGAQRWRLELGRSTSAATCRSGASADAPRVGPAGSAARVDLATGEQRWDTPPASGSCPRRSPAARSSRRPSAARPALHGRGPLDRRREVRWRAPTGSTIRGSARRLSPRRSAPIARCGPRAP